MLFQKISKHSDEKRGIGVYSQFLQVWVCGHSNGVDRIRYARGTGNHRRTIEQIDRGLYTKFP